MTPESMLLKAVDYTLQFLKIRENADEKEKQLKFAALEAFREAVVVTRSYIAERRDHCFYKNGLEKNGTENHGSPKTRDTEKELELSRAWNSVGVSIAKFGSKESGELHDICFGKADYWSDPSDWKENREGEIDISLDRVSKEISRLLEN